MVGIPENNGRPPTLAGMMLRHDDPPSELSHRPPFESEAKMSRRLAAKMPLDPTPGSGPREMKERPPSVVSSSVTLQATVRHVADCSSTHQVEGLHGADHRWARGARRLATAASGARQQAVDEHDGCRGRHQTQM